MCTQLPIQKVQSHAPYQQRDFDNLWTSLSMSSFVKTDGTNPISVAITQNLERTLKSGQKYVFKYGINDKQVCTKILSVIINSRIKCHLLSNGVTLKKKQ